MKEAAHPFAKGCPRKIISDTLKIASAPSDLKLDLASGQNCREGYESVDRWKGAKHVVDLLKFPWPFKDNSCEALHCSHFVEHIPHGDGEKDLFFAFFDECWRILKPGSILTVITPCGRSNRAWYDPTHRRAIMAETFLYLNANWRKQNLLDHYNVLCDFDVTCDPAINIDGAGKSWMDQPEVALKSDAVKGEILDRRMNHEWNWISDWSATLKARKG